MNNPMNHISEYESPLDAAHRKACARGQKTYVDPETQGEVFTRAYLVERGYCCNQGCRHCPYGELNITIRFKSL